MVGKKIAQLAKNRPIVKKSPNLVTLLVTDAPLTFPRYCCDRSV
jgi:hypothetical protein